MSDYYFTQSHECFRLEGENVAVVSITQYAVDQLGEITYVQLPAAGQKLAKGASFGEIESVKTVSELYAPVSGEVSDSNASLEAEPELVNEDSLSKGWLLKIKLSNPAELEGLMNKPAYDAYLEGLH